MTLDRMEQKKIIRELVFILSESSQT